MLLRLPWQDRLNIKTEHLFLSYINFIKDLTKTYILTNLRAICRFKWLYFKPILLWNYVEFNA